MPINKYVVIGNLEMVGSFNSEDEKSKLIFQNQKAIDKIYRIWDRVPYKFNFCFVHKTNDGRGSNWVKESINNISFAEDDAINIVMTHNATGPLNYMPMTAWIMAHRLDHILLAKSFAESAEENIAIERKLFSLLLKTANAYGIIENDHHSLRHDGAFSTNISLLIPSGKLFVIVNNILTMRSARENLIGNVLDIMAELLAQYIITGDIKFNSVSSNVSHDTPQYKWEKKNHGFIEIKENVTNTYKIECIDKINALDMEWEELRNVLKVYFDTCLTAIVGKLLIW